MKKEIPREPRRILVIEDDLEISELLCVALTQAGFLVFARTDGRQAIDEIESLVPDIVVTDVMLPGLDGREVIHELERRFSHLGIVVMSGKNSMSSDVFPFFEKPFPVKGLVDFIVGAQDTLSDVQTLKRAARKHAKALSSIGKVILFYPDKGWGLLRVVGRDEPLYVNASDVGSEKRYVQLVPGQIVEFAVDESATRGARARKVQILQDVVQHLGPRDKMTGT